MKKDIFIFGQLQQILNNGGLMISDKCYNTHTKNENQSIKIRYAPSTDWNQINQTNIVICNNMIDMNDTNIEAKEQGKISFNQKSVCSAGDSTAPNNTPNTDNKTTDKSDITDNNNQTNINDNTENKETETKDNELPNESYNKDSNNGFVLSRKHDLERNRRNYKHVRIPRLPTSCSSNYET